MTSRALIVANWKMHGLQAKRAYARALLEALDGVESQSVDVAICPPATLIADLARDFDGSWVRVGGQTCHALETGAHTGDVSARMLADAGARLVIVGHSERRALGETSAQVQAQAIAALGAGLTPIICVGESLEERQAGRALELVCAQVRASAPQTLWSGKEAAFAYEPIWAIGTGQTAEPGDAQEMHAAIRATLVSLWGGDRAASTRILYGGSMKPANAATLLGQRDVDGGLVGGASLDPAEFAAIIRAGASVGSTRA